MGLFGDQNTMSRSFVYNYITTSRLLVDVTERTGLITSYKHAAILLNGVDCEDQRFLLFI